MEQKIKRNGGETGRPRRGARDAKITDGELMEVLRVVFDRSKRTPEQTKRAVQRARMELRELKS